MNDTLNRIFRISISCLLLSSCGTPIPRNDLQNLPSLIEIIELNIKQQTINLRISHRNRSPKTENHLSCELSIQDQPSIKLTSIPIPDLTTYATETVQLKFESEPPAVNFGLHNALPYELDCLLSSNTFGKEHIVSKATIYPIPGKENSYR